jgi:hypothetical protein
MTTWTQSDLWSREWPNRRLPVSGGSHAKYVLVRSGIIKSSSSYPLLLWIMMCEICEYRG